MTDRYKEDRISNQKAEPTERSSLKFVLVPIILLSMFIGFGVTYLTLRTDQVDMSVGDTRSLAKKPTLTAEAGSVALKKKGQQIYASSCQACHQATGAGIPGAFPPLDGSEWVTGHSSRLVAIVLHGVQGEIAVKGQKFSGVMPPFKDQLSHDEVAAVATYVRSAWSNRADPVLTDKVESTSEKTKSRQESWKGQQELDQQKWD